MHGAKQNMNKAKYIWMNGEMTPWAEAKVHILTHTLHYGNGAIEGTKAYKTVDGRCAIFKLTEHTQRLLNSSKMTLLDVPYTVEELNDAQIKLLQKNKLFLNDDGTINKVAARKQLSKNPKQNIYLAQEFENIENLRKAKVEGFEAIDGIGEVMAGKIVEFFQDEHNRKIVNNLLEVVKVLEFIKCDPKNPC